MIGIKHFTAETGNANSKFMPIKEVSCSCKQAAGLDQTKR